MSQRRSKVEFQLPDSAVRLSGLGITGFAAAYLRVLGLRGVVLIKLLPTSLGTSAGHKA